VSFFQPVIANLRNTSPVIARRCASIEAAITKQSPYVWQFWSCHCEREELRSNLLTCGNLNYTTPHPIKDIKIWYFCSQTNSHKFVIEYFLLSVKIEIKFIWKAINSQILPQRIVKLFTLTTGTEVNLLLHFKLSGWNARFKACEQRPEIIRFRTLAQCFSNG
jgi:hypothetical protein